MRPIEAQRRDKEITGFIVAFLPSERSILAVFVDDQGNIMATDPANLVVTRYGGMSALRNPHVAVEILQQ